MKPIRHVPRSLRATTLLALVLGLTPGCAAFGAGPHANRTTDPISSPVPGGTLQTVNGTRLYVRTEGSGAPVLLVHGGPLLDHGYLVAPFSPLRTKYQLVFYDQRLSGRSEGQVDSASVTLAQFVADIEGVREALDLERIHLVGHSWGGLLAMKYALAHPERLRSLVLVSPMAPTAELWRAEEAALQRSLEPTDTAGLGELRASPAVAARHPAAIERLLQLSFRAQLHDPALADRLRFEIPEDYAARGRQFARVTPELSNYDLLGSLRALRVPTLLVYGGSEAGASIGAEALRAAVPNLVVEVIPNAGHFAFLEQPEIFRRILERFLEGT